MLILSNFSYASHLMLCGMSKDTDECQCTHNNGKAADELKYSDVSKKCCTNEVKELKNSNNLSTVKIDLPKNINLFSPLVLSTSNLTSQNNTFTVFSSIDKEHVPKLDIPVLISSLLI